MFFTYLYSYQITCNYYTPANRTASQPVELVVEEKK
jgi:hypothetical protein